MEKAKKRRGDRKDGYWVRDVDAMHVLFPFLAPSRADNEAVMSEVVDLTAVNQYIAKKNAENPEFKYTIFHVICAAIAKTCLLRPKMNRFYAGQRLYQRKDIVLSFMVKKRFVDDSEEGVAIITMDQEGDQPPIEQIYEKVKKIVYSVRKNNEMDGTTDKMDMLVKLPRPLLRLATSLLRWLDYHGMYPDMLMYDDPYFSSVFLSNLGSIKMHANYHHLADWGTNSCFVLVGEKKPTPFYQADGSCEVREALELGMTIDERIADGMYFANSIKLLRRLFEQPELLDLPMGAPVE
ncbi:MAG: 2-oxo acid dehydrogenase subunit E2 [Christensenellaceae bacterium]|jgi:pyruvate/2-oxoglutarate dehydrogenase complex dihydrolipoamide acyltransferase (E2) component|nr:2-oxo acid dehydrogenase subunit E2 [Christensenellaceae bacterium]